MSKYYIAGPMSGIPHFNFPAFFRARYELQSLGLNVYLPVDMDEPEAVLAAMASDGSPGTGHETWGQCLAKDIELIADHCDGVIFLPGWEKSRGAKLEAYTALMCGHQFMEYNFDGPPIDLSASVMLARLMLATTNHVLTTKEPT